MKRIFLSMMMLVTTAMSMWADGYHFQYEKGLDQHVIYLSLTDGAGNVFTQEDMADADYYVGAFVNGLCRGEAKAEFVANDLTLPMPTMLNVFTLNVQGDGSKDNGQPVIFRVYKEQMMTAVGTAEYRIPQATASVSFQKDATTGTPSNTYKVKFTPAVSIQMEGAITVHKGAQVDMLQYITVEPEGSLIPYPLSWTYPDAYVAIGDNLLDAIAVTEDNPANIQLTAGTDEFALPAWSLVTVDNPATGFEWTKETITKDANDPSKGTVTVALDGDLSEILTSGYTLTPADATTTYNWISDNASVVGNSPVSVGLVPIGVGKAVLTGTPMDGSTETSPQLTVNVVNPVTAFDFPSERQGVVVIEVGENLNKQLLNEFSVMPTDATDKSFTISSYDADYFDVQANGELVAKQANSSASTVNLTPITITANDGFGATAEMKVAIIPTQPTAVTAVSATLYENNPDAPLDITEKLKANLKLTPDDLNIEDFIMSILPTDESVVSVDYSTQDAVYMLQPQAEEKSTELNVTVMVLDKANIIVSSLPGSEDLTVNINTKDLFTSFTLDVRMGLSGFALYPMPVTAKAGETIELTLVEQPQGVDFDPTKISLEVDPSVNLPEGWTFATVEKQAGDATGLKWVLNTKSVGNGTINVVYQKESGKEIMGTQDVRVLQEVNLNAGWQWISFYQGPVYGKDSLQSYLLDRLGEIRADNGNIYNDDVYGYFGNLNVLEMGKTYKVRMKEANTFSLDDYPIDGVSSYFYNHRLDDLSGAPVMPVTVAAEQGWNWIGNPYQYEHALNDIFGNTTFTEDDKIKGKESFATYTNGAWAGTLSTLVPGEGYMFKLAQAGNVEFTREFSFAQPADAPAAARGFEMEDMPWTIDHSRFADNMSMIAYVGGFDDNSHITLYAFRGNECRGRGVAVGDRQFITIHGEQGERYTFCAYDELTGEYYDVLGSRAFTAVSGSFDSPVPLFVGETTTVEAIKNKTALTDEVYDLQGRRVSGKAKKGIYVQQGRKVVK